MTRQEALKQGLTKYLPNVPCQYGHYERYASKGDCVQCQKNKAYKWARENPIVWLLSAAKHRAKKQGLDFCITEKDVIIPTHCPVFFWIKLGTVLSGDDSSPSLDRIDNNLGYVPGNVCVISWVANRLKRDLTQEQIERLYIYTTMHGAKQ